MGSLKNICQAENDRSKIAVLLPPAVTQNASDGEGRESKVHDAGVKRFSRPFSHLLNSPGTNGTLGITLRRGEPEK